MNNSIFVNNLVSRFILIFSHQISVLIAILLLGVNLDPHSFGLISVYLILFQLSFIITEWGYSIFAIHILNEKNETFLTQNFSNIFFSKLIFIFLNCFIVAAFFYLNEKYIINKSSIYFLILSMLSAAFNPLWFLQAVSKVEAILIPTIFGRIIFIIIVIFFVKENTLELFFLGQFISFIIPTFFGNLFIIKKFNPKIFFKLKEILGVKKNTFGIFVSTVTQNQIFSAWGFFLTLVSNPVQIAYFMLADQILRAGNGIGNIFQEIYMSIKKKVKKNILFKNLVILFLFTICITLFGYLLIEPIMIILFSNKFLEAIPVIKFTIISWFFITIIKITNYPMTDNLSEIQKLNSLAILIFFINIFLIFLNFKFVEVNAINVSKFFLFSVLLHLFLNILLMKNKIKLFL